MYTPESSKKELFEGEKMFSNKIICIHIKLTVDIRLLAFT